MKDFVDTYARAVEQGYQLIGDPVCEPFKDKFENELAGWGVDINIEVANNLSVC